MNTRQFRTDFQVWFRAKYPQPPHAFDKMSDRADADYVMSMTQIAWECYTAGHKHK